MYCLLKWHAQLITISASGDGDEEGMSFNRLQLSFETATEISQFLILR